MQIQHYFRMIQQGWWIILLTTLTALIGALTVAYQTAPMYRSSAQLIISPNPEIGNTRDIANSLATLDKRSIAVTYAEVLKSNRLTLETATSLGIDQAELAKYELNTVVLPEANILEVSAAGPNPTVAANLVNQVGQLGTAYISKLYPAYVLSVLDAAVPPTAPFSPQPARDASLAVALGLLAGVALAILRGYLSVPIQAFRERVLLDGASGAYNRRHVRRLTEEHIASDSAQLSMMLIRADDLKDYLDVLPETSAHRLLHKMAQILRNELRGYDVVGRWNDTAFAVVLPSTPENAANRTVERVRAALIQPISVELQPEPFLLNPRVSVVTRQPGESAEELIHRVEGLIEQPAANDTDSSKTFPGSRNAMV